MTVTKRMGLVFVALAAFAVPSFASVSAQTEDEVDIESLLEDSRADEFAFWKCSAQAPRLVRVFTVRKEGYESDVQAEALDQCNSVAVLQCWPLGCTKLRRP